MDLANLTPEQKEEVKEMYALFAANPKLARDKADEIMTAFFEKGEDAQSLINKHYASLANLRKSKNIAPLLAPILGE